MSVGDVSLFQPWELDAITLIVAGEGLDETCADSGRPYRETAFNVVQRPSARDAEPIVLANLAKTTDAAVIKAALLWLDLIIPAIGAGFVAHRVRQDAKFLRSLPCERPCLAVVQPSCDD